MAFAAAAIWLLAAPGVGVAAIFGAMFVLAFGPMTEHVFWGTSTIGLVPEVVASSALLAMILLRYRWNSRYFIVLSHVGFILWCSWAFVTLMGHTE